MSNIDRFIQDLDNIIPPKKDLSKYEPITERREFLEPGTVVTLSPNVFGEITITKQLVKYQDKMYDYEGDYQNEMGDVSKAYFDEDEIDTIKKKEVNHK